MCSALPRPCSACACLCMILMEERPLAGPAAPGGDGGIERLHVPGRETSVSLLVMNSSSTGMPSLVLAMPRLMAGMMSSGFCHPFAIAAEGPRHRGIVAGNIGRAVFLGRHRHHLQLDRHAEIVQQDRHDRNPLAHRGLEIHPGESDRGIAPDIDAELVGFGQFGAPSQGRDRSRAGWSCPSRYRIAARRPSRTAKAGRAGCRHHG